MPPTSVLLEPSSLLAGAASAVALSLLLWRSTRRPPGLPPGPGLSLPLLGHLYLLDKDPRPKFNEWRRQYGDVFSLYMGRRLVVVLSGYDVIKEALLKCGDVVSDRPRDVFMFDKISKGQGVAGSSGSLWKEQRKTSLEILRELGMGKNTLAEKVQGEVHHYIEALNSYKGQATDIADVTQNSVSNIICSVLFGKRFEYGDLTFLRLLELLHQNMDAIGTAAVLSFLPWLHFLPGDPFKVRRTLRNVDEFHSLMIKPQLKAHLESYTEGSAEDLAHAYIREIRKHEERGDTNTTINCDNLIMVMNDLFFTGTETTATTIRWALIFFLHNPEVQDKCYDEIQRVVGSERAPSMRDRPELTYVEATIMESLRLGNIVPVGAMRGLSQEFKFRGYTIPEDAIIMYSLESVLLDPQTWDEPLTFRPERFIGPDGKLIKPDEFIPFGIGRRNCLGESLARMELFLYLTTMIQHFRFLPPEDGQLPSPEGVLTMSHAPKPYKVRIVPRN